MLKTHLPNGNCSALVTQREATELRVIDEAFDTDGESRFYECYNFLAWSRDVVYGYEGYVRRAEMIITAALFRNNEMGEKETSVKLITVCTAHPPFFAN